MLIKGLRLETRVRWSWWWWWWWWWWWIQACSLQPFFAKLFLSFFRMCLHPRNHMSAMTTWPQPPSHSYLTRSFNNKPSSRCAGLGVISSNKLPREMVCSIIQTLITSKVSALPADLTESLSFQRTYASSVYSIFAQNVKEATSMSFLSIHRAPEMLHTCISLMADLLK